MRYYQIPGSTLFSAENPTEETEIYKAGDIAAALTVWGLPCTEAAVDIAPQMIIYHFNLKNPMQGSRLKPYITALEQNLHVNKISQIFSDKANIAIAIPRITRRSVAFRSVITPPPKVLNVGLGYDLHNKIVKLDIRNAPHILIAGATGGGKSVCLNTIICGLLAKCTPNDIQFLMIDTKKIELSAYNGIPHLLAPPATDGKTAFWYLKELSRLMSERWNIMNAAGVKHIDELSEKYPHFAVIIDELADLMLMNKEQIEPLLVSIAQLGRAAGIHLILATQRPTVNVVTGLLKANIPCRIALQTASIRDSMTILDHKGAEQLTGRGDAILKAPDSVEETRLQVAYISDTEITKMTEWWKTNGVFEM